MKANKVGWPLFLAAVLTATTLGAAEAPPPAAAATSAPFLLEVDGDVPAALHLDEAAWRALPRVRVTGQTHGGDQVEYEGVDLAELLARAGQPLGEALRGREVAKVVMAEASDGYRAAFALVEVDPASGPTRVLVADRRVDGKPFAPGEGPLRLVVPNDHRNARWVRQVHAFRVIGSTTSTPTAAEPAH
jgi:hypothetical protein